MNIYQLNKIFTQTAESLGFEKENSFNILISKDKLPFFIFSPVQKLISNFEEDNKYGQKYIIQECFRHIELKEIIKNPLATTGQLLYSIFDFQYRDMSKVFRFLEEFLIQNLKLKKEQVYIMYDEENIRIKNNILQYNFMDIAYDKNRLICPMPIKKETMYVKVNYHYKGGLIPIINLVFIGQEENLILLDSIIYPERLLFILNNNHNVYEEDFYNDTINIFTTIDDSVKNEIYFGITSHLRMILYFYSLGIRSGAKKANYVVRKLEREVFAYLIIEDIKLCEKDILIIFNSIYENSYFNFNEIKDINYFTENFFNEFIKYKKNLNNIFRKVEEICNIRSLNDEDVKYLHESLGLKKEILIRYLEKNNFKDKIIFSIDKNRQYPYNFNFKENNIDDPLDWAEKRRKTKFYKY